MTRPRLCATVTGPTTEAVRAARDAVTDADMVEIRLDGVASPDVVGVLAGRRVPVVVTCRPRWEGGAFEGSEEERRRLLAEAVAAGAEYVDVEWKAGFADLLRARAGRGLVVSHHDFEGTPADLADRLAAMRGTGAEVVKLAVQPRRLADVAALFEVASGLADEPRVLIAMGWTGLVTRVLASRLGSCWTYAGSLEAVGQVSVGRLVDGFRFRDVGARTAVYGVAGAQAAADPAAALHNAAFRVLGADAVSVPFETADADDFLALAGCLGLAGARIVDPLRRALAGRATGLSEPAARAGEVDTIRFTPEGFDGAVLAVDRAGEPAARTHDGRGFDIEVARVQRECGWWLGRVPAAGLLAAP